MLVDFTGRLLIRVSYTLYEVLLVPGATKEAHWLLGLALATHPAWGIQQKEPRPGGLSQAPCTTSSTPRSRSLSPSGDDNIDLCCVRLN